MGHKHRYRIQESHGRVWDSQTHRFRKADTGQYTTYKTEKKALSVARKSKDILNRGATIVPDID